jgi:hypothetical protein
MVWILRKEEKPSAAPILCSLLTAPAELPSSLSQNGIIQQTYNLSLKNFKSILCYGSVTWTLAQTSEQILNTSERKILQRIYGRTHEGGCWRPSWNNELCSLYNEPYVVKDTKIRRLEWAGHINKDGGKKDSKNKGSKRKLPCHKTSGKTKN